MIAPNLWLWLLTIVQDVARAHQNRWSLNSEPTAIRSRQTITPYARQITASAVFNDDILLRKRDYWYICGYYDVSTLSCNNGAYCKVTSLPNGAYGYCSTVLETSNAVYTAVVDYTDWGDYCGPSTICCVSTAPYGFEYYFTDDGDRTTRMYGCDTSAYTAEGTAANNFVTGTGIDLFSESTARAISTAYPSPTYPTFVSDDYTSYLSDYEGQVSTSSIFRSTLSDTAEPTSTDTGKGGDLENASNLATIVGTAVGVPMAVAAVAVAIYFGLKGNAKRKAVSKYTEIEMDERAGAAQLVR